MDYEFEGEDHYIRYTPTDTPGCYDFTTRTVTNGGEVQSHRKRANTAAFWRSAPSA